MNRPLNQSMLMSIDELNTDRELLRTIKYGPQTGLKMEKIALKLCRSNRLVFAQMVDYFYRSKKDPLGVNDELLKNTLLRQHKEYIGFIKTQESELLIPTKREVDRMIRNQKAINDFYTGQDEQNKSLRVSSKAYYPLNGFTIAGWTIQRNR